MFVLQILGAILFANFVEVLLHKYVLHGLGKKKNSWFSFHWSRHHNLARKSGFYDHTYEDVVKNWKYTSGEIYSLIALAVITFPVWFLFPVAYYTFLVYIIVYYICHRHMHLHPYFAIKYFPWHVEHHCLGNQEHSWGVLLPIWDFIFRTRIKDINKKEK